MSGDLPDLGPSPLESTLSQENVRAYEEALARLPPRQQEAVMLRVEMGFSYEEVAAAVGNPSANAARMMVVRALRRLMEEIREP